MLKRILTGAVLVAIVVGVFFLRKINTVWFQFFMLILATLGTVEMLNAFKDKTTLAQKVVAGVFPVAFFGAYTLTNDINVVTLTFFVEVLLQLSLLVINYDSITLEGLGLSLLTVVYPSVMLFPMSLINLQTTNSFVALLTVFAISPCSDTLAYFTGYLFGKRKMCEAISPKKTIAGGIGGIFGGILGACLVYFIFKNRFTYNGKLPAILFCVILGGIGAVATIFGDLVESAIKRKTGIKDMGNLLPGHGGIIDRIDSILFACPVVWLAFSLI